ncbi:beta-galactosidase [Paraglaciecola aquimarina]|uniref:Beta-galactosidase n=1 Tax=Paraglaciecola aquimarina TaxID=1235557 RepID=A0ABU3SW52_9ALTE|nr:beta-galactosidase [Paraglaciecola aquimarina]MDU0354212.1 beta-galactosidase [Paraglaciecola aquimarina]
MRFSNYKKTIALSSSFLLTACAYNTNENSVTADTLTPTIHAYINKPEPTKSSLSQENHSLAKELGKLIIQAQQHDIPVEQEVMTLHTASLFTQWIAWDENNIETLTRAYSGHPTYRKNAEAMALTLPQREKEGVNRLLKNAISDTQKLLNGKITRPKLPQIDWSQITVKNGQLEQNGRPVYLADYVWKPEHPAFEKYYGQFNGYFLSPRVIEQNGSVDQKQLVRAKTLSDETIGTIFLDNNVLPKWIKQQHPNISVGQRHYGKYDIDHPAARELYTQLFRHFVPIFKGSKRAEMGYMLFNEPSFFTATGSWNTGEVSDFTKTKFEKWLSKQYSSITELNNNWQTQYAGFEQINIAIPIDKNLRGTPIWYDWNTFNNKRVTELFTFFNQEIKKHDPEAKTHIKLMPLLWYKDLKDHGMDFEALISSGDIIGFDAKMLTTQLHGKQAWKEHFSLDWQSAAMSLDFMKSVRPEQMMYDSENHFISSVVFADPYMKPEYVNSAYWLGLLHGINATKTWVWYRNADGSLVLNREEDTLDKVVNVTHLPEALHSATKTFMDANRLAPELSMIQKQNKPIRIFYSKTSAINQKGYMDGIHDTHRQLSFLGVPIGFTTENILTEQDINAPVMLIKDSQHVTAQELAALQQYLNNGGTIIMDQQSLTHDEYDKPHRTQLEAKSEQIISLSNWTGLDRLVSNILAEHQSVTRL